MSRIIRSNIQVGNSYVLGQLSQVAEQQQHEEITKHAQQILENAQKEAHEILSSANIESVRLLENARLQAEEIVETTKQQGYEAGFSSGQQQGFNQVLESLTGQIKSLDAIANATFKVKREILISAELEILQLSVMIAEKMVRQKLEISPQIIVDIVKAAINQLKDKEEVRIVVNPQLSNCLYEFSDELKRTIKGLGTIKISEDKTVPADGVIVESPDSRIDARLETQIAEITRTLMSEFNNDPAIEEITEEIEIRIHDNISYEE